MGISITFDVSGGVAWESYLSTSIFIHALALAIDIICVYIYIYMVSITFVLIYLFLSISSISCAMCTYLYLLLNNVSTLLTRNLVPRHSHRKVDQVTIPHF